MAWTPKNIINTEMLPSVHEHSLLFGDSHILTLLTFTGFEYLIETLLHGSISTSQGNFYFLPLERENENVSGGSLRGRRHWWIRTVVQWGRCCNHSPGTPVQHLHALICNTPSSLLLRTTLSMDSPHEPLQYVSCRLSSEEHPCSSYNWLILLYSLHPGSTQMYIHLLMAKITSLHTYAAHTYHCHAPLWGSNCR